METLPTGFMLLTTQAQQNAMMKQPNGTRFCMIGEVVICAHPDRVPCEIEPDGTITDIQFSPDLVVTEGTA